MSRKSTEYCIMLTDPDRAGDVLWTYPAELPAVPKVREEFFIPGPDGRSTSPIHVTLDAIGQLTMGTGRDRVETLVLRVTPTAPLSTAQRHFVLAGGRIALEESRPGRVLRGVVRTAIRLRRH